MTKSGVAHLSAENDIECINYIRELISYLPGNNMEEPPFVVTNDSPTRLTPELSDLVPTNPNQPYNIKEMIEAVADDNNFFELQAEFAANIVTGYIRLNGKTIGVVANQPLVLAGTLDINASIKAARFVRFCDAFNIPLLTLVDVPGFLPGVDQEYGGIIRNGAKLLYAYCEATVPKVTVITRKAYGGAYDVMSPSIPWRCQSGFPHCRNRCDGTGRGRKYPIQERDRKVTDSRRKAKGTSERLS